MSDQPENQSDKREFGSGAWIDVLRDIALELTADADLSGIDFSFCEEYTDPPAHILLDGQSRAGFTARISDGKLTVEPHVDDDANTKITVDYQGVLPLARLVFDNDPAREEEGQKKLEALVAARKMRMDGAKKLSDLVPSLAPLHDVLAKRTA